MADGNQRMALFVNFPLLFGDAPWMFSTRANSFRITMAHHLATVLDCEINQLVKAEYLQRFSVFNVNLHGKEPGSIRNRLKALLSSGKNKAEGLCLLHQYLDICNDETFAQDAPFWLHSSYDGLTLGRGSVTTALVILTKIIQRAKHFPEFSKSLSTQFFTNLIDYIINENNFELLAVKLLDECISSFPGFCVSRKYQIKSFVLARVGQCGQDEANLLQSCFAKLIFLGNPGGSRLKHQQLWIEQVRVLLYNMTERLALCWPEDIPKHNPQKETYFTGFGENLMTSIMLFMRQFEFLCGVMKNMLTTDFPFVVEIPAVSIIKTLACALSIKLKNLSPDVPLDDTLFLIVLPSVQCNALRVLEALIISCKSNLVIHSQIIHQMLLKTLESSYLLNVPSQQTFLNLRIACYEVVAIWLSSLGAYASLTKTAIDRFIKQVAVDIASFYKCVSMRTSSQLQFMQASLQKACLKATSELVVSMGLLFTKEQYNNLCSIATSEVLSLYRGSSKSFPPVENRLELLKIIRILVINVPASSVPPSSLAVVVFNEVLRIDGDYAVQSFCRETLCLFANLTNPKVAVFQKHFSDIEAFHDILEAVQRDDETNITPEKTALETNCSSNEAFDLTPLDITVDMSVEERHIEGQSSNGTRDIPNGTHENSDKSFSLNDYVDASAVTPEQAEDVNKIQEVVDVSDNEDTNDRSDDDSRSTISGTGKQDKRDLEVENDNDETTGSQYKKTKYDEDEVHVLADVKELLQDFVDTPPDI